MFMKSSRNIFFASRIANHWKILIGLVLGIILGLLLVFYGYGDISNSWIKPWGTIFIKLLKLIAIPLIFFSLVMGISSLQDISRLSKMGVKTLVFYIFSTLIAVTIGLTVVNIINPGDSFPAEKKIEFQKLYGNSAEAKIDNAHEQKSEPLSFIVDLIPENIFSSASNNSNMLQIIFFAFLFGIALILVEKKKVSVVIQFVAGVNEIILKMITIIMRFAPYGVFALMVSLIVDISGDDPSSSFGLLWSLGMYALTVVIGLIIMIIIVYPILIRIFTNLKYKDFLKGIFPAQLLAFSTSSSAATLPVTMKQCEQQLNVSKEVSSFVLPVGATINMDGTSLYQAVAAVFIATVFGYDLTFVQQLTIIFTATLASIGSAAVPSAGIVMLIIVLESIGIPGQGIALIFAIDRPLDMLRTVVNVTGDSTIASIISRSEQQKKS